MAGCDDGEAFGTPEGLRGYGYLPLETSFTQQPQQDPDTSPSIVLGGTGPNSHHGGDGQRKECEYEVECPYRLGESLGLPKFRFVEIFAK